LETVKPPTISVAGNAIPPSADEHVIEGRRARLAADSSRRQALVAGLTEEYSSRRTALLGAENEAKLRGYTASHKGDSGAAEERVAASLAFARDLRVDVEALVRLNQESSEKIAAVLDRPLSTESTMAVAPPTPSATVYTSWGSWESGSYIDYWSCDGYTAAAASYLDPPISQNGGIMALQVTDAGDHAGVLSWRENGFLVEYTPPISGRLIVSAYLSCVMDDHFISTWDEWGWSSFTGKTREEGIFETYSDWDDWSPNEEVHTTFVMDCRARQSMVARASSGCIYPIRRRAPARRPGLGRRAGPGRPTARRVPDR
jgi:hypothetical protein